MAFTPTERAQARKWMAYSVIGGSDPAIEQALNRVEGNDAGEVIVREYLTELAALSVRMKGLQDCLGTMTVGRVQIDQARALMVLRGEGRRLVGMLADALQTTPLRDVYSPATTGDGTVGTLGSW